MNPQTVGQIMQGGSRSPTPIAPDNFGGTFIPSGSVGQTSDGGVAGAVDPTSGGATKRGNALTHLLPTIGGIAGGLIGLPLNALDLVSGVGGTALDIGAAGAGGALGKALENKLEGAPETQGVLGSGIANATGMGVGGILGKIGGAIGGKVIAPFAEKEAGNLLQGQVIKGTLDNETAQLLRHGMGISDLRQVGDIAPLVTGSEGALATGVKQGLTEADQTADFSGLGNTAKDLVAKNQMQLKPNTINDLNNTIQSALLQAVNPEDVTQMATRGAGSKVVNSFAPGALKNVLPENAFKVAQNFEGLASSALNSAYDKMGNVISPDQLAKYKIFNGLAQEAKQAAFGGENPIPLTDNIKSQIISNLDPLKDINPAAHTHFVNEVTNAKNLQDLRPLQAPMVEANKALSATQNITSANAGRSMGDVVRTVAPIGGGMVAGPVGVAAGMVPAAIRTTTADRLGSAGAGKLASKLTNPQLGKIASTLTKIGAISAANLPNDIAQPQRTQTGMQTGAQGDMMDTGTSMEQNPTYQLYQQLLAQEQASPMNFASSLGPVLNQLAPTLQRQEMATPEINALLSTYGQAGGAQGMGGGLLSRITGLIPGTPAHTYQQQQAASAAALAPFLGISPEQAQTMLPSLMQTPQTAAPQIGGIQSILGGIAIPGQ